MVHFASCYLPAPPLPLLLLILSLRQARLGHGGLGHVLLAQRIEGSWGVRPDLLEGDGRARFLALLGSDTPEKLLREVTVPREGGSHLPVRGRGIPLPAEGQERPDI